MYIITIADNEDKVLLRLKTEVRKLAGGCKQLAKENELQCEVVTETKPKVVKFRGID